MHFLPPQPHQFSIVGNRANLNERVRKWSLKFSVAAAITRGTCQREMITCRGVTCIMLTGELIAPISSCLGPAATCRELECDISATYY